MKTFVTKEEYDISIQGICNGIETLFKRIEALENKSSENENEAKTTMSLMNGEGHMLEIEGTEKQIEAFEAERKERNEALFPSAMSFEKTVGLALEHGLSIKKLTLNREGK